MCQQSSGLACSCRLALGFHFLVSFLILPPFSFKMGSNCIASAVQSALCKPGQPQTQRSTCICLLSTGTKVVCPHAWAPPPVYWTAWTFSFCFVFAEDELGTLCVLAEHPELYPSLSFPCFSGSVVVTTSVADIVSVHPRPAR